MPTTARCLSRLEDQGRRDKKQLSLLDERVTSRDVSTSSRRRGRPSSKPPLSVDQVLRWADAHHARMRQWPQPGSGAIAEAPGETWRRLDHAMRKGQRGLPRTSLSGLLARYRGVTPLLRRQLTVEQVLVWAQSWKERTGRWPTVRSGPVPEAAGLTWRALDQALRVGSHALPAGSSLFRLLRGDRDEARRRASG